MVNTKTLTSPVPLMWSMPEGCSRCVWGRGHVQGVYGRGLGGGEGAFSRERPETYCAVLGTVSNWWYVWVLGKKGLLHLGRRKGKCMCMQV